MDKVKNEEEEGKEQEEDEDSVATGESATDSPPPSAREPEGAQSTQVPIGAISNHIKPGRELREEERVIPPEEDLLGTEGSEVVIDGRVRTIKEPLEKAGWDRDPVILEDGEEYEPIEFMQAIEGHPGQKLPDITGSGNPTEWNVDWSESEGTPATDGNGVRGINLTKRQREIFRKEFKKAGSEEAYKAIYKQAKQSKTTSSGENDNIHAETFAQGLNVDTIESNIEYEPSEPEKTGARLYALASREFVRGHPNIDTEDGNVTLWRGLKNHVEDEFRPMVTDALEQLGTTSTDDDGTAPDEVSIPFNPVTNTTPSDTTADNFTGPALLQIEAPVEDVVAVPDALFNFDTLPGGGNEDEIKIIGGERTVPSENIHISGETSLKSLLSSPVSEGYDTEDEIKQPLQRFVRAYDNIDTDNEQVKRGAQMVAERIRAHDQYTSDDKLQQFVKKLEG